MIFTAENTLLIGSILLFVSIVVGKTGYRFGVPTLLLFLVVGMLFGSDGLGLQFHDAKDAQFIGMVALSIILFSGGMDTKFREIKPILGPGIVLSTVGVLLTALFTGLFIWWLSGSRADYKLNDERSGDSPDSHTCRLDKLYQDNGEHVCHRVVTSTFQLQHGAEVVFQIHLLRT